MPTERYCSFETNPKCALTAVVGIATPPPVLVVVRSRQVNAIAQQRLQALPVCHSGTGAVVSTQNLGECQLPTTNPGHEPLLLG